MIFQMTRIDPARGAMQVGKSIELGRQISKFQEFVLGLFLHRIHIGKEFFTHLLGYENQEIPATLCRVQQIQRCGLLLRTNIAPSRIPDNIQDYARVQTQES